MKEENKYPKEVILEYRRKVKAGEFGRKIISREPVTLNADKIELSCGHTESMTSQLIDATQKLWARKDGYVHKCDRCAEEWLKSQEKL